MKQIPGICMIPGIGLSMLLFADREAEISAFPSEGEILPVRIGQKPCLLEVELALAVHEALLDLDGGDLR